MKLSEQTELEVKLLEHKIRFFLMVNGIISGAMFLGVALLLYKVMRGVFE